MVMELLRSTVVCLGVLAGENTPVLLSSHTCKYQEIMYFST